MFHVRSARRGETHGSRRRRGGFSARVRHLVPGHGCDLGPGAGGRLSTHAHIVMAGLVLAIQDLLLHTDYVVDARDKRRRSASGYART